MQTWSTLTGHDLNAERWLSLTHSFCYFADYKWQRKPEFTMLWNNVQSIMLYYGISNGYKAIILMVLKIRRILWPQKHYCYRMPWSCLLFNVLTSLSHFFLFLKFWLKVDTLLAAIWPCVQEAPLFYGSDNAFLLLLAPVPLFLLSHCLGSSLPHWAFHERELHTWNLNASFIWTCTHVHVRASLCVSVCVCVFNSVNSSVMLFCFCYYCNNCSL